MKKIVFLLVIALSLQSCFSMRHIALESELRRNHIGRSSTGDLRVTLGPPNEQFLVDSREVWLYYTNGYDVNGRYGKRTTRFSFDDNRVVRNVISDATVERKRYDHGATAACIGLGILAAIGIPLLTLYAIANNSN